MVEVNEYQRQLEQRAQDIASSEQDIRSFDPRLQQTQMQLRAATPQSQLQVRQLEIQRAQQQQQSLQDVEAAKIEQAQLEAEFAPVQQAQNIYQQQVKDYEDYKQAVKLYERRVPLAFTKGTAAYKYLKDIYKEAEMQREYDQRNQGTIKITTYPAETAEGIIVRDFGGKSAPPPQYINPRTGETYSSAKELIDASKLVKAPTVSPRPLLEVPADFKSTNIIKPIESSSFPVSFPSGTQSQSISIPNNIQFAPPISSLPLGSVTAQDKPKIEKELKVSLDKFSLMPEAEIEIPGYKVSKEPLPFQTRGTISNQPTINIIPELSKQGGVTLATPSRLVQTFGQNVKEKLPVYLREKGYSGIQGEIQGKYAGVPGIFFSDVKPAYLSRGTESSIPSTTMTPQIKATYFSPETIGSIAGTGVVISAYANPVTRTPLLISDVASGIQTFKQPIPKLADIRITPLPQESGVADADYSRYIKEVDVYNKDAEAYIKGLRQQKVAGAIQAGLAGGFLGYSAVKSGFGGLAKPYTISEPPTKTIFSPFVANIKGTGAVRQADITFQAFTPARGGLTTTPLKEVIYFGTGRGIDLSKATIVSPQSIRLISGTALLTQDKSLGVSTSVKGKLTPFVKDVPVEGMPSIKISDSKIIYNKPGTIKPFEVKGARVEFSSKDLAKLSPVEKKLLFEATQKGRIQVLADGDRLFVSEVTTQRGVPVTGGRVMSFSAKTGKPVKTSIAPTVESDLAKSMQVSRIEAEPFLDTGAIRGFKAEVGVKQYTGLRGPTLKGKVDVLKGNIFVDTGQKGSADLMSGVIQEGKKPISFTKIEPGSLSKVLPQSPLVPKLTPKEILNLSKVIKNVIIREKIIQKASQSINPILSNTAISKPISLGGRVTVQEINFIKSATDVAASMAKQIPASSRAIVKESTRSSVIPSLSSAVAINLLKPKQVQEFSVAQLQQQKSQPILDTLVVTGTATKPDVPTNIELSSPSFLQNQPSNQGQIPELNIIAIQPQAQEISLQQQPQQASPPTIVDLVPKRPKIPKRPTTNLGRGIPPPIFKPIKRKSGPQKVIAEVRRRGQFIPISKALPVKEALDIGIATTRRTLARTFRLRPASGGSAAEIKLPRQPDSLIFRSPAGRAKQPLTFVERSPYALRGSPTAVREIISSRRGGKKSFALFQ